MRPTRNYIRDISQKLKAGFLKEPPIGYLVAKTMPPVQNSRQLGRKIPHARLKNARLIKNLLAKNPDLALATTTPSGDIADEPYPLRFARYQYEAMQQGLTEDQAYEKAKESLHDVEDVAFGKLEKMVQQAEKFGDPGVFLSQEHVASIDQFKAKVPALRFADLDPRDQGLIDHFLQTQLLGWAEVDRITRMGNPIFVEHFVRLREALFPLTADVKQNSEAMLEEQASKFMWKALKVNNPELIRTKQPFYVEEYVEWFNKTKHTTTMPDEDHQQFREWVVATLAIEHDMRGSFDSQQQYIVNLMHTYFPHLRKEYKDKDFTVPDIQELKDLLFENKVGYIKHNNKLHIRRFYRLPSILFPEETMTQTLLLDRKRLREILREEGQLEDVLSKAGIAQAKMETIRQELVQMQTSARVRPLDEIDGLSYTSLLSSLKNLNMPESSATEESNPDIDAIWEELRKEEDGVAATTEDGDEDADNSGSSSSDSDSDEEESKGGNKQDEEDDDDEDLKLTADQVQDILKQIEPEAKNHLQALEQEYYRKAGGMDLKTLRTPLEIEAAKWAKADLEAVVRVKLQNDYERKEAARRAYDAEQRGVGKSRRDFFRYPF